MSNVALQESSPVVDADFPDKLQCLFQPKRYKVLYGGRGGAKSWGIARALILLAVQKPLRILCAREYQNSIKDSVHRLLKDQIETMGLGKFFEIKDTEIVCPSTGSTFNFEGIKHNVNRIRSYEGVDVCWVEEAANVSKSSWDILIPTIRKPNSEIWLSFNPDLETDETYQRFIVSPPDNAIVVKMSWRDNPWFPEVLHSEMEDLKRRDYDQYLHVWEGHCKQMLEGAIYAQELRDAEDEDRITVVPYDRTVPVDVFLDLGRRDMTSIWFAQHVAMQYRLINFYQNSQKHLDHYLQFLQRQNYTYGTIWLPHDAKAKQLGTKRSIEEQVKAKGFNVRIVPKLSVTDGINAARTIFPMCFFDRKRCADGIQALRHYRYDVDADTKQFSVNPLHDWASHPADAFRYFAVAMRGPKMEHNLSLGQGLRKAAASTLGWMR